MSRPPCSEQRTQPLPGLPHDASPPESAVVPGQQGCPCRRPGLHPQLRVVRGTQRPFRGDVWWGSQASQGPLNWGQRDIRPWGPRPPAESEAHGLESRVLTAVGETEEASVCPAVLSCVLSGAAGVRAAGTAL